MVKPVSRLQAFLLSVTMLALAACGGQGPAPTAAPAKPTEAAKPASPAASPAAPASPAASPAVAASPVASPAAAAAGPVAKVASGAPTKLGVLTPLSPPGDAAAGQLITRGAELAMTYVNQRMGGFWSPSCQLPTPIELVKGDDAGTPEKGIAAFRKMVQDDKVVGVMGQFHSSVTLANGPIADQLKVPMFSTQSSSADITGKHFEYVFQTHTITPDRSAAVSEFIKGNGFKRVAIVAESTDYGTGNTDDIKKALAGVGGLELRDWIFDNKTTDMSPLLLQVKAFDPDLIYNLGVGAPAYLMIKQAYDTGLMPKALMVVSYDAPIRPEFWQNVGDKGKGIVFVTYYHPQQALTDPGKWMQQEYQKTYNEPALYSSFAAFGNVLVLAQAINQACSTDGPALVNALESGKFTTWNQAGISFPKADGLDWHRTKQPLLLIQYTEVNQEYGSAPILYPPSSKTGELKRNP